MSSRSPCAAGITAKFIDVATKQHGGQKPVLNLSGWQMLCGARHTRSRDTAFVLELDAWLTARGCASVASSLKWDCVLGADPLCEPTATTCTPRSLGRAQVNDRQIRRPDWRANRT